MAGFRQTSLFQSISYLIEGKANLLTSISIGGFIATAFNFIKVNTPSEILGCSIALWSVALSMNVWDIITGIKTDVYNQKLKGLKWKFNPDKGYKAFEKIIGFTCIIWFLYSFEKETVRLNYSETWTSTFNYAKFILFFYVVLIELKSIGQNNEVREGKKGELFVLLDSIIAIVNDGIISNLKKLFRINKTEENE